MSYTYENKTLPDDLASITLAQTITSGASVVTNASNITVLEGGVISGVGGSAGVIVALNDTVTNGGKIIIGGKYTKEGEVIRGSGITFTGNNNDIKEGALYAYYADGTSRAVTGNIAGGNANNFNIDYFVGFGAGITLNDVKIGGVSQTRVQLFDGAQISGGVMSGGNLNLNGKGTLADNMQLTGKENETSLHVYSGAAIQNTTVSSGTKAANLFIYSGASANSITIDKKAILYMRGGRVTDVKLNGTAQMSAGRAGAGITTDGQNYVSGAVVKDSAKLFVGHSARIYDVELHNNASMMVNSHNGSVSGVKLYDKAYIYNAYGVTMANVTTMKGYTGIVSGVTAKFENCNLTSGTFSADHYRTTITGADTNIAKGVFKNWAEAEIKNGVISGATFDTTHGFLVGSGITAVDCTFSDSTQEVGILGTLSGGSITGNNVKYIISGTADGVTVESGARMTVISCGVASNITAGNQGLFYVSNWANRKTVEGLTIANGGSASARGYVNLQNLVMSSGGSATLGESAYMTQYEGYTASNVTVAERTARLYLSGGKAVNTVVSSGGYASICTGGGSFDKITVSKGGGLYVANGGSASDITAAGGAEIYMYTGSAVNLNAAAGVNFNYTSGTQLGGSNTNIAKGLLKDADAYAENGVLYDMDFTAANKFGILSGLTISRATVKGTTLAINSGVIFDNITISSGGYVSKGAYGILRNAEILKGGSAYVKGSGTASNIVVSSGAFCSADTSVLVTDLQIKDGGTAIMYTVGLGGDKTDFAAGAITNHTMVYAENGVLYGLDTSNWAILQLTDGLTVSNGKFKNANALSVTRNAVLEGGVISSGGAAVNITSGAVAHNVEFIAGASVKVSSGGLISGGSITGGTGYQETVAVFNGGKVDGLLVAGGRLLAYGGGEVNNCVAARTNILFNYGAKGSGNIVSGADMYVYNGAEVTDTTVAQTTLYISNGGVANDTLLTKGNVLVCSGGTANDTFVSGGFMGISRGAAANGLVLSGGSAVISSGGAAYNAVVYHGKIGSVQSNGGRITVSAGGYLCGGSTGIMAERQTDHAAIQVYGTVENFTIKQQPMAVNGTARNLKITSDGSLWAYGNIQGVEVDSGTILTMGGGNISDVIFHKGMLEFRGGTEAKPNRISNLITDGAVAVTFVSGCQTVFSSAIFGSGATFASGTGATVKFNDLTLQAGAARLTYGAGVSYNNLYLAGGSATIASGGVLTGHLSATMGGATGIFTVSKGASVNVDGMYIAGLNGSQASCWISAGNYKNVVIGSNGTIYNASNTGATYDNVLIESGGRMAVYIGNYLHDMVIKGGGYLDIGNYAVGGTCSGSVILDLTETKGGLDKFMVFSCFANNNKFTKIIKTANEQLATGEYLEYDIVSRNADESLTNYTLDMGGGISAAFKVNKGLNISSGGAVSQYLQAVDVAQGLGYGYYGVDSKTNGPQFDVRLRAYGIDTNNYTSKATTTTTTIANGGMVINGNQKSLMYDSNTSMGKAAYAGEGLGATDGWLVISGASNGSALVYGGGSSTNTGAIRLVLEEGEVKALIGGAASGGSVKNVALDLKGGKTAIVNGGGQGTVTGNVTVQLTGGETENIYGGTINGSDVSGSISLKLEGGSVSGSIVGGNRVYGSVANVISGGVAIEIAGNVQTTAGENIYGGGMAVNATGTMEIKGETEITVKGGNLGEATAGRGIFGGSFAENSTTGSSDVTITLTAGTVGNVFGGGWAQKNGTSSADKVNIVVSGEVTGGNIYGGGAHSNNKDYIKNSTTVDSVNILIDNNTGFESVFAGGQYDEKGKDLVTGDALITVTGNYTGGFTTNLYGEGLAGKDTVQGTSTLDLSDFTGALTGKVGDFDVIKLSGDSFADFTGTDFQTKDNGWELDFTERAAAKAGSVAAAFGSVEGGFGLQVGEKLFASNSWKLFSAEADSIDDESWKLSISYDGGTAQEIAIGESIMLGGSEWQLNYNMVNGDSDIKIITLNKLS